MLNSMAYAYFFGNHQYSKNNDTTPTHLPLTKLLTANPMLIKKTVSSPSFVLIIENDDTLREILVELLDFSDVPCLDTRDGCEGVLLFEHHQHDIDLVIMDMGLFDTNGATVLQELEAIRPNVKVIIISGQEKKKLDLQFKAHANVSVVQKPFDTFAFLKVVSNQLSHPV